LEIIPVNSGQAPDRDSTQLADITGTEFKERTKMGMQESWKERC